MLRMRPLVVLIFESAELLRQRTHLYLIVLVLSMSSFLHRIIFSFAAEDIKIIDPDGP